MPDPSQLALLAAVMGGAAFVRASIGFGDALVAMPVLALLFPISFATPFVSLCTGSLGLLLLFVDRGRVDLTVAWRLVAGSLVGVPVGAWVLSSLPKSILLLLLGGLILVFCGQQFVGRMPAWLKRVPGLSLLVGFVSGAYGGAVAVGGPPVVMYGQLEGWPPGRFRATLTSYFVPYVLYLMVVHALRGWWTTGVFASYGVAMPAVLLGLYVGNHVHHRIPARTFARLVRLGLLVMGAALVVQGISGGSG